MDAFPRTLNSSGPARRASRRIKGLAHARRRRAALGRLQTRAQHLLPVAPALGGGLALAYFLDPAHGRRRRKLAVQRVAGLARRGARRGERKARYAASQAVGAAQRATHPRAAQSPPGDDVTLARKVETEIFRPADSPKATVNVNAVDGVVFLRGGARTPEQISELESKVRAIPGVRDVKNLLHLPGTPVPTDPGGGRTR
jgi:hypothetical protein